MIFKLKYFSNFTSFKNKIPSRMEFSPVEKPFSARTFRRKALFRTGTEGERAFPVSAETAPPQ